MLIERQIDRALFTYDSERGALTILSDGAPITLSAEAVYGLVWFFKMANVAQHAARVERERQQDMQEAIG